MHTDTCEAQAQNGVLHAGGTRRNRAVHERNPRGSRMKTEVRNSSRSNGRKADTKKTFGYCYFYFFVTMDFFSHLHLAHIVFSSYMQIFEVNTRANRVHYPRVHLVKPAADVHMISGGTVHVNSLVPIYTPGWREAL